MRSCDYLINFNRQSYLDLSVLEALSVGARIIMSATDGHREFIGTASDGIITSDQPTIEGLVDILLSEERIPNKSDLPSLANIDLYLNRYTDEIYRMNLDALAVRLLGDM